MTDEPREQWPPRAAPIADLPLDALLGRAGELAQRWAMALVLERPLEHIGEIPLEDLAREAPGLCAQALQALGSDAELDRLADDAAPDARGVDSVAGRLAAMCGATDAAMAVTAVEALRGVLWEALLAELDRPGFERPSGRRRADAGDRLAHVCARLGARAASGPFEALVLDGAPRSDARRVPGDVASSLPWSAEVFPAGAAGPRSSGAVIVDEHVHEAEPPRRVGRPALIDEIEIRDERGAAGPAAWIGSIGRQLELFDREQRPFAVLLVELANIERGRRELLEDKRSELAEEFERSLVAELGEHAAGLTREAPGRYWLLVGDMDRIGAARLAGRIAQGVAAAVGRGEVAIGTAVCPEDGREAAALAAHADLELYATRLAARSSLSAGLAPAREPA